MFPPLCLPAASRRSAVTLDALLTHGQLKIVEANPHYEIRFKIVEIWESFKERIREKFNHTEKAEALTDDPDVL
jgi:hypothetical protein